MAWEYKPKDQTPEARIAELERQVGLLQQAVEALGDLACASKEFSGWRDRFDNAYLKSHNEESFE